MKKLIICGKGGAGKTTLTSKIVAQLKDEGAKALIIDADPAATLKLKLDLDDSDIKAIGSIEHEEHKENKEDMYSYIRENGYITGISDYIDYAEMGHHMMNSCLCGYNNSLAMTLDLVQEYGDYDYVVVDREAGLEHLTRSVYKDDDTYLICVAWPTPDYLKVVEDINLTADALGSTENRVLVINDHFVEMKDGLEFTNDFSKVTNIDSFQFENL